MDNFQLFAKNVRRIRRYRDLTQAELAQRIGVSCMTLNRWECGKNRPDVGVVPDLAAALGVTPGDLFAANSPTS